MVMLNSGRIMKGFVIKAVLIVLLVPLLLCQGRVFATDNSNVISLDFNEKNINIVLSSPFNSNEIKSIVVKGTASTKKIFDFENVYYNGPTRNIENSPFKGVKVKVGQFSAEPKTFRVVFESESQENLDSIDLSSNNNALTFKIKGSSVSPKIKPVIRPVIAIQNNSKGKIIIDPGHGGKDPGANRLNILEKDINLAIAQKLEQKLLDNGFTVIMTRKDDTFYSLKERVELANIEMSDIFISIHVNASESPEAYGIETHWFNPQSIDLAKDIQDSLASKIDTRNRGIINSRFYVIRHTLMPSVLIETGFISNENERNLLIDPEKQDAIAEAIFEGIVKFTNKKRESASTN